MRLILNVQAGVKYLPLDTVIASDENDKLHGILSPELAAWIVTCANIVKDLRRSASQHETEEGGEKCLARAIFLAQDIDSVVSLTADTEIEL